jgi:hypothetical protein
MLGILLLGYGANAHAATPEEIFGTIAIGGFLFVVGGILLLWLRFVLLKWGIRIAGREARKGWEQGGDDV